MVSMKNFVLRLRSGRETLVGRRREVGKSERKEIIYSLSGKQLCFVVSLKVGVTQHRGIHGPGSNEYCDSSITS